jgi:hypothetical protein
VSAIAVSAEETVAGSSSASCVHNVVSWPGRNDIR